MSLPLSDRSPLTDFPRPVLTSAVTWPSRLIRATPLIAAAVALVAGLLVIDLAPVGGFYDDAFYIILAKSIATGHGYRNLNLPGAPFATHYPPGYPAFLAFFWWLAPEFPGNTIVFKLLNALLLSMTAGFAVHFARERLRVGTALALVATIAGTITVPALYLSSMVVSEPLFLALLIPMLLWAERATGREGTLRTALALGACAGLVTLVRSHGVALIAAIVLIYAVKRRWREAAATAGAAMIVLLPWILWQVAHDAAVPSLMRGDYASYGAWFADGLRERGASLLVNTVRRNVPEIIEAFTSRLRPAVNPLPSVLTSICFLVLAAAGSVRLAQRARVTAAFLFFYVAIVVVWPFPPVRFLLGVWVLAMLLLAAGIDLLSVSLPDEWSGRPGARLAARAAGIAAASVLVIGTVSYNAR